MPDKKPMQSQPLMPYVMPGYKPLSTLLPLESPLSINLSTTTRCNFRCKFCYKSVADESSPHDDMPFEIAQKLANDILGFKTQINTLELSAYGESLLYPHIIDTIKLFKATGKIENIRITTNGSLLTKAVSEQLVLAGLDSVIVSLNGLSDAQYSDLTQSNIPELFGLVYENIKRLYAMRKNCRILVKIVDDFYMDDEKKFFVETFGPVSSTAYVEPLANQWRNVNSFANSGLVDAGAENRMIEAGKGKPMCSVTFHALFVRADGVVGACCDDREFLMAVGDVKKDSLVQIWNGDKMAAIRKAHLTQTNIPRLCGDCRYYEKQRSEDLFPYREELIKKYGFNE